MSRIVRRRNVQQRPANTGESAYPKISMNPLDSIRLFAYLWHFFFDPDATGGVGWVRDFRFAVV